MHADVAEREDLVGQGTDFPLPQQIDHRSDLTAGLAASEAHRVQHKERYVFAKHSHAEISVLIDVALADLDESAVFGQYG